MLKQKPNYQTESSRSLTDIQHDAFFDKLSVQAQNDTISF